MRYIGNKKDWNKSGIYEISNIIDDRVYIGSTNSLRDRFRHHRNQLINNRNPSLLLQRFANKYGIDTLVFTVIELCNEDKLLEREEFYLNERNCKLNAMLTPLRQAGYKHKPETVEKMKKIAHKAFKNGRKVWNKGKSLTEEEKQSYKGCSKGVKRPKNNSPICLYDFDGETLIECFDSWTEAVEKTGVSMSAIWTNLTGKFKKTKKGIWKKKDIFASIFL